MFDWSLFHDWPITLACCCLSMLCLVLVVPIILANMVGNRMRRKDRERWRG